MQTNSNRKTYGRIKNKTMNEKQQMTTTLLQVPDFGQAHTDCGLVKLTTSAQTWHKPGTEVQQNKLDL